jgi:hypothetical protein
VDGFGLLMILWYVFVIFFSVVERDFCGDFEKSGRFGVVFLWCECGELCG